MNTLTLTHIDYAVKSCYNKKTSFWEVEFSSVAMSDVDTHLHLTRIDMETLRDNAKRLYDALAQALQSE